MMNLSNSRDPYKFVMDLRPAALLNDLRKKEDDEPLEFDFVALMGGRRWVTIYNFDLRIRGKMSSNET